MNSLLRIYKNLLVRHPYALQSIQTGILMGSGDVISQTIIERHSKSPYTFRRTAIFLGLGTFFVGPALTVWYRLLNRLVGAGGKIVVFKKVAVDQLVFAPVCLLTITAAIKTLQGSNLKQTKEEIEDVYLDMLLANYKLWPMAQIINFYYVPLNYQVLYVQIVALAWNSYFSYKTRPKEVVLYESNT